MEVVTTSGPATGIAADLQKIANMSKAANAVEKTPLAIASGVDHKNIKDYIKAGARFFLVASSIKKGFNGLDPIKLKELLAVAQNQETLLTEEDPSLYASSFNKIIKKMSLLANHDSKESRASVSKATPVLAPLKNKNRRVIAIGDIHGNLEELKILWSNLINTLGEDELNHSTLVFLGDYCDRGPNTKGVFDWLIELKKARVENPTFGKAYFIAGNHDFAMAAFLGALPVNEQPSPAFLNETAPAKGSKIDQVWKFKLTQGMHYQGRRWGGLTNYNSKSTFQSYGISTGFKAKKKHRSEFIEAVPQAHKDFLAKIPWIHEEKVSWKPGRLLFVHAGLLPDRPAEEQITALGSRDLSNTVIHESGQPWRFASFSNRKEVLEPHPDLIGKALIISGHHGFTSLSNESQIILDASGGRPSKSNPLQALILPEKIIVDSNK